MSDKSLQIVEEITDLSNDSISITPYGVEINYEHKPTIEQWHKAVTAVQKVHGMMQFYLGDLMVYAESPTTGWGQSKYEDLINATGYDYDSLRKFTKVARRFPAGFRQNLLEGVSLTTHISFTHFDEVASLSDEQAMYFLQKVAEGRWTVNKLRAEVQALKERKKMELGTGVEEKEYIPTFSQRYKEVVNEVRDLADNYNADTIRLQVVKNGHVIDERLVEI